MPAGDFWPRSTGSGTGTRDKPPHLTEYQRWFPDQFDAMAAHLRTIPGP